MLPKSKFQAPNSEQARNPKFQKANQSNSAAQGFGYLNFEIRYCLGFGICYLGFYFMNGRGLL